MKHKGGVALGLMFWCWLLAADEKGADTTFKEPPAEAIKARTKTVRPPALQVGESLGVRVKRERADTPAVARAESILRDCCLGNLVELALGFDHREDIESRLAGVLADPSVMPPPPTVLVRRRSPQGRSPPG